MADEAEGKRKKALRRLARKRAAGQKYRPRKTVPSLPEENLGEEEQKEAHWVEKVRNERRVDLWVIKLLFWAAIFLTGLALLIFLAPPKKAPETPRKMRKRRVI